MVSGVIRFALCFAAPIASLWLVTFATPVVVLAASMVTARRKVTPLLSLGETLVFLSAVGSIIVWLIRLAR